MIHPVKFRRWWNNTVLSEAYWSGEGVDGHVNREQMIEDAEDFCGENIERKSFGRFLSSLRVTLYLRNTREGKEYILPDLETCRMAMEDDEDAAGRPVKPMIVPREVARGRCNVRFSDESTVLAWWAERLLEGRFWRGEQHHDGRFKIERRAIQVDLAKYMTRAEEKYDGTESKKYDGSEHRLRVALGGFLTRVAGNVGVWQRCYLLPALAECKARWYNERFDKKDDAPRVASVNAALIAWWRGVLEGWPSDGAFAVDDLMRDAAVATSCVQDRGFITRVGVFLSRVAQPGVQRRDGRRYYVFAALDECKARFNAALPEGFVVVGCQPANLLQPQAHLTVDL